MKEGSMPQVTSHREKVLSWDLRHKGKKDGPVVPALLGVACRRDIDRCGVSKLRIIYD
jgi:hypothetical protein